MRNRTLLLGAALAVTLADAPAAVAHPADPIVMRAHGGTQDGSLAYFTASKRSRGMCSTMHADGTGEPPPAVAHDGSALTWLLPDKRKPTKVVLTYSRYVRLGVVRVSRGGGEVHLEPREVRSRGKVVAWRATWGDAGTGEVELSLSVAWRSACGTDDDAGRVYRVFSTP